MTTFTATPVGTFVSLAVTDVTARAVVTITRDPSPGLITVRGTPTVVDTAGATVLSDVEFPFGVDITYTAVLVDPDTGAQLETLTAMVAPIVLPDDGMTVSDPFTNVAVTCTVIDERDHESPFRGARFDLAGRAAPVYVLQPHGGWTWTIDLHTPAATDRATLDALLRAGRPVLLRVTHGCDLKQGWVAVEDVTMRRTGRPASNTGRRWAVRVAELTPPESNVETVTVTLADVHDYEPSTLQALANRPPTTLLDLTLAVTNA